MSSPVKVEPPEATVPLWLHSQLPGLPNAETLKAEEDLARDKRLFHHIAVLSDAHKKKSIANPASSVVASASHLIPQLLDAAPNCGMRLMATDISDEELEGGQLPRLFTELKTAVPTKKYFGTSVANDLAVASFLRGSQPIAEHFNLRVEDEVANTYQRGNIFAGAPSAPQTKQDLLQAVPRLFIAMARHRLGIMGATGSHFLALMQVDKTLDSAELKKLGLKAGQYVFFMHTGSGIIGRLTAYLYSAQARKPQHAALLAAAKLGFKSPAYKSIELEIKKAMKDKQLVGYKTGTNAAELAFWALGAADNQGFANRAVLAHRLDQALQVSFGRQIKLRLVYDTTHINIAREKHFDRQVWLHRNGATRARTGEPGLIAPFEGTYGYIGVGQSCQSTFHSANHELGKLKEIPAETFAALPKFQAELKPVKLYQGAKISTVKPKATHAAYAEAIAGEIEQNKILKLAARLRTVAIHTYE